MKHTIAIIVFCFFAASCAHKMPHLVQPIVIKKLPHSRIAFTQGLIQKDRYLYESVGKYGKSAIRMLSENNGELISEKKLPKQYFAEGITILDNKIYQLTWKSGLARVYSLPDIKLIKTIRYKGEGWGLTSFEDKLIMSNGSNQLYVMTKDFGRIKTIDVKYKNLSIDRLNELEYANQKIYANRWKSNHIFEIDYHTGTVARIIDFSGIRKSLAGLDHNDVLNGIAYNATSDSFYITGKNWPAIFEVKLPEPIE